jgi:putative transcriptional regulator
MLKFNLKKILFDRDMNQSDLHRKTGIRYNTINAYYHNYIKRINIDDFNKMCKALGCTPGELLEYIPDKE